MLHRKHMQVLEIMRTGGSKYIFKFKIIPGQFKIISRTNSCIGETNLYCLRKAGT